MKPIVSKKWGPFWPRIAEEHITPLLKQHGFAFSSLDDEDGFIHWEKESSSLFDFEIRVNPHDSTKPRYCEFTGVLYARSAAVGRLLFDAGMDSQSAASVMLFVPLSWMVRHANPSCERFTWEISYDDTAVSLEVFRSDMANCLPPLFRELDSEEHLIDFILNIDAYSKGIKGGPPFRPVEILRISALRFVMGDATDAERYLREYETSERARLHRLWGLPNEKPKLEQLLLSHEKLVSNLSKRYETL